MINIIKLLKKTEERESLSRGVLMNYRLWNPFNKFFNERIANYFPFSNSVASLKFFFSEVYL